MLVSAFLYHSKFQNKLKVYHDISSVYFVPVVFSFFWSVLLCFFPWAFCLSSFVPIVLPSCFLKILQLYLAIIWILQGGKINQDFYNPPIIYHAKNSARIGSRNSFILINHLNFGNGCRIRRKREVQHAFRHLYTCKQYASC